MTTTRKMLCLVALASLFSFTAQDAKAWYPTGWVYANLPWYYQAPPSSESAWYWFNDDVWVNDRTTLQWAKFRDRLNQGWLFFSWPYAYSQDQDTWYYINQGQSPWVCNMTLLQWSVFGVPAADPSDYLVIDLSGGPTAVSYPVSYLSAVPAGGWTDEYKTTKLVLRRIPAGTFSMGSPTNELGRYDTEIQHQVTLTKDFYLGVFEVTQKQWERVMGTWPSWFNRATYRDSRPVDTVSYYAIRENPNNSAISPNWPQSTQVHADSFMGKLRAKTGLTTLDLPTEAQREHACRAGTGTALNSGKNLTNTLSCPNMFEVGRYWYNGGSGYSQDGDTSVGTTKVGLYQPNAWGLYDMHGNVAEWCLDWLGAYPGTVTDPPGAASGSNRMARGGGWDSSARNCRSANRGSRSPASQEYYFGFRLARTLP